MINNRQGNRRRGRNNSPRQNNNRGGDQGNRIDNRARGNATQLLEKYKNMARDAQTQGDRVLTEYYLQFADHYFRVLADVRQRQEEQQAERKARYDERGQNWQGDGQNDGAYANDGFSQRHNDAADDGMMVEGVEHGVEGEPMLAPIPSPNISAPNIPDNRDEAGSERDRPIKAARSTKRREPRDSYPDRAEGRNDARPPRRSNTQNGGYAKANSNGNGQDYAGLDASLLPPSIAPSRIDADNDGDGDATPPAEPKPRRGRRPKVDSATSDSVE